MSLMGAGGHIAVMQNAASFNDVIGCGPRTRETHEAAQIHHASRQRGSGFAARCARAAAHTARRLAYVNVRERPGRAGSLPGIRGRAAAVGLDRGPQRALRYPLDRR